MVEHPTASEVKRQIARLASEHVHEQDAALTWLLDHRTESRPALIEVVKAGQPVQQVLGALSLLGRMGEPADVPLLANLLTHGNPQFRWGSAQALAQHPSPEALTALLEALEHSDLEVVSAAAVALGVRGDEAARAPLERLLEHRDESIRYRAVFALRQLGAAPSHTALRRHREHETSADVRALIDEALGERGPG